MDWTEWDIETRPRWRMSSKNWDWVIYGVYWDVEIALKVITPVHEREGTGYFYAYGRSYIPDSEETLFSPAGVNLVYVARSKDFEQVRDLVETIAKRIPPKDWNGDVKSVLGR